MGKPSQAPKRIGRTPSPRNSLKHDAPLAWTNQLMAGEALQARHPGHQRESRAVSLRARPVCRLY